MNKLERTAFEFTNGFVDQENRVLVRRSLQPNSTWMDKVFAFHKLYGAPTERTPVEGVPHMSDDRLEFRVGLISEEFDELKAAIETRDIVEMADAMADIAYVVCGFAWEAGIDLQAVMSEVHASNMTKMGEDGNPVIREDGKVMKGPNYIKPDIRSTLFGTGE